MTSNDIREVLAFLAQSRKLESVERYTASLKTGRNTTAEHSWRLALMALVVQSVAKIDLNLERALSIALVHDLAEAKTGDIDAYTQIREGRERIERKEAEEETAMRELTDPAGFGDGIYALWREYEESETVEAKFIQALDGIEGFLHLAEGGIEAYVPPEFHADYATRAVEEFDAAVGNFPELKDLLDAVRADLKAACERQGIAWIEGDAERSSAIRDA
jgi:putative hydrolases of HD superfamily